MEFFRNSSQQAAHQAATAARQAILQLQSNEESCGALHLMELKKWKGLSSFFNCGLFFLLFFIECGNWASIQLKREDKFVFYCCWLLAGGHCRPLIDFAASPTAPSTNSCGITQLIKERSKLVFDC